jgi:hydrogenase maturation factor
MKIFLIALCVVVLLGSVPVSASELSHSDVRHLSYVMGIDATITSVKEQADASNKRQIDEALKQVSKTLPKLTTEQLSLIRNSADRLLKTVSAATNGADIQSIYVQEISSSISKEDADKVISFFSTSEGRNAYLAAKRAEQKMVNYIIRNQEKAMSEGIPAFLNEIKSIVQKK